MSRTGRKFRVAFGPWPLRTPRCGHTSTSSSCPAVMVSGLQLSIRIGVVLVSCQQWVIDYRDPHRDTEHLLKVPGDAGQGIEEKDVSGDPPREKSLNRGNSRRDSPARNRRAWTANQCRPQSPPLSDQRLRYNDLTGRSTDAPFGIEQSDNNRARAGLRFRVCQGSPATLRLISYPFKHTSALD